MKKLLLVIITVMALTGCNKDSSSLSSGGSGGTAQNGSLSKFIISGNYLYTISNDLLTVYNITTQSSPILESSQRVGFSIQTILAYSNKLFIGSNDAMYIYSLDNPGNPKQLSQTTYFVRGKDPIIAMDNVAYSTVRNGSTGSVLNVFDISNPSNPLQVRTIGLTSPYGLAIKNNVLYVCEAENGFDIFNIGDRYQPVLVKVVDFNETIYDVIVEDNILVCYIQGGISLFDISNPSSPALVSTIKN